MNVLSFETENLEVDDGYSKEKRNCYFYVVDGERICVSSNFQPLSYYEILETPEDYIEDSKLMVILNLCSCGDWCCDSYVAQVSDDGIFVYWKVYNINVQEIIDEYTFEKQAYEKTIKDFQQLARKEYLEHHKKGAYIFYWENGETCPIPRSSDNEIIKYWNEKNTKENPLSYFEDVKTGELFSVSNNKILKQIITT